MVLLGLLCGESMSGYELKAAIERSVGQFWQESYGQIYPALKQLNRDRLVSRRDAPSGGRKRQIYRATKAGRAALAKWLDEDYAATTTRNEMLLKVFFGAFAPDGAIRRHLERTIADSRRSMATLDGVIAELKQHDASSRELQYWLLTLDLGRRVAQARAEWATAALQEET